MKDKARRKKEAKVLEQAYERQGKAEKATNVFEQAYEGQSKVKKGKQSP
jgi:hypothetical protein